jgi:small-conductance mechanosensitive channel
MSALTDALNAQLDRIAAKIAESVSAADALGQLQAQKADLEAQFEALRVQFDEQSAALQASVDRMAGM